MKKMLLIVASAIFVFSGCKKDDECATDVASVSGAYKVTSAKYKASAASPEIDGMNLIFSEDCEKDDIVTLNSNGTYTVTDAGTVCDPVGGDNGTWSLSGSILTLDGEALNVDGFDCSNLTISGEAGFTAGDKMTITYTKQ